MAKKRRERQHDQLKAASVAEGERWCAEHKVPFDRIVFICGQDTGGYDALVYVHHGKDARTLLLKLAEPTEDELGPNSPEAAVVLLGAAAESETLDEPETQVDELDNAA